MSNILVSPPLDLILSCTESREYYDIDGNKREKINLKSISDSLLEELFHLKSVEVLAVNELNYVFHTYSVYSAKLK